VRGSRSIRSGRGQSEAAGTQVKGGENSLDSILGCMILFLLGTEHRFIYMYNKAP